MLTILPLKPCLNYSEHPENTQPNVIFHEEHDARGLKSGFSAVFFAISILRSGEKRTSLNWSAGKNGRESALKSLVLENLRKKYFRQY